MICPQITGINDEHNGHIHMLEREVVMRNIMLIPLDERPCNYNYPLMLARDTDVNLLLPPREILGYKKKPAQIDDLWEWLTESISDCDYLIVSIDMLVYGGIVPSRLHGFTEKECLERLERLKEIKDGNKKLKIMAFNLIMRVPSYNSSEEEPDYYAYYGARIFRYSWLWDVINRGMASDEDKNEFENLQREIPGDVLEDYINRRKVNSSVNLQAVDMVKRGIIDFLIIPLDDCSEYGFSSLEQQKILDEVEKNNLQDKVYIYPGADEVGCTLLARAYNELNNTKPCVYVRYSSTIGPQIIPKYEDRPLNESIKSQVIAAGGIIVDNSSDADIVLMVNSPALGGHKMGESPEAVYYKDRSYYSMRNLREFVEALKYYIGKNKRCSIADVAFCNGADQELLNMLLKQNLIDKIYSYAGWNTSGNTLGTVISHSMIKFNCNKSGIDDFYVLRLLEDWGYQAMIRQDISREDLPVLGLSYFDIEEKNEEVAEKAKRRLEDFKSKNLEKVMRGYEIERVYFPWNRLFEIGIELKKID